MKDEEDADDDEDNLGKRGDSTALYFFVSGWWMDAPTLFLYIFLCPNKRRCLYDSFFFFLLLFFQVYVCVCVFRAAAARLLLVKVTTHTTVVFFFFGRRSLPCVSLLFFFSHPVAEKSVPSRLIPSLRGVVCVLCLLRRRRRRRRR